MEIIPFESKFYKAYLNSASLSLRGAAEKVVMVVCRNPSLRNLDENGKEDKFSIAECYNQICRPYLLYDRNFIQFLYEARETQEFRYYT